MKPHRLIEFFAYCLGAWGAASHFVGPGDAFFAVAGFVMAVCLVLTLIEVVK